MGELSTPTLNRNPGGEEAVCRNASSRAGVRGGARVGKPRWLKILMITAGSSIAARSGKGPLHCGQVVMSMANMRLSNCAQRRRARVEAEESSPSPSAVSVAGCRSRRARSGSAGPRWVPVRHGSECDGAGDVGRVRRGVGGIPAGSSPDSGAIAVRGFELEDDLAG